MEQTLIEYVACPDCGADVEAHVEVREGSEVMSGELRCMGCGNVYPIVRGVPRMNRVLSGLENVARTFGYEWKAHHEGRLERGTLFGRTREEDWEFFLSCFNASEDEIKGTAVLDAGCGSGSFTRLIGEHGAAVAIGVDINEAVDEAFDHCRDLPNVHIVQGNIFALPFKKRAFDFVWSSGVIHHTPDASGAHRSLARHVKPGGTLYVWVYTRRFNPFRFVKTIFDRAGLTRLPESALFKLSKAIAYPSLTVLWAYQSVRKLPGLEPKTAWGWRTVRRRTVPELQLTWFDALSPEYDTRHTEPEVVAWFEREGFEEITAIEEPKVGVRGRAPAEDGVAGSARAADG